MKKGWNCALLVGIMLAFLVLPGTNVWAASSTGSDNGAYLQGVKDFIQSEYNFDVKDQDLTEGAMKGMFDSLDPYSEFFTNSEAEEFLDTVGGDFEGIGVVITKVDNYVVINQVLPLTPAEKAGVMAGDKIAAIDDVNVVDASSDEVAARIRGEKGSTVTLGILRSGAQEIKRIEVVRDTIQVNPVTYEINGDIGYLRIDTFNGNTYQYVDDALAQMDKAQIKKIILDLRDNTGGEVDQAVLVAKRFVPAGVITKLEFKNKDNQDVTYSSDLKEPKYKLAVLVNGMTASASEILSGAIQDTDAGTLIGTKTFGKARVQNVIPILTAEAANKYQKQTGEMIVNADELISNYNIIPTEDEIGGWAKITTGTYTTPKGRFIDKAGLDPDIAVPDSNPVADISVNSIDKLTKSDKPGLNAESINVYNAEKVLRVSGYDVDQPDMTLDAKTFSAICQFQKDAGLSPYGVLDFTTQDALNTKLGQVLMQDDQQYAKAVEILK